MACILSQKTGRCLACNLCAAQKFKCKPSALSSSSCPPRFMPAITSLPSNTPAATPKSDPPACPGPSTHKGHLLPKVIIPPLSSVLGRCHSSSHRTLQEVDKLLESPVPTKKCKGKSRTRIPSSSPPPCSPSCPPSPPSLPNVDNYRIVSRHTTMDTLTQSVLGRAPHKELIYPELVGPRKIINHTPWYSSRRAAFWQLDADKVPMTRDGLCQVRASMAARMAIIQG